MTTPALRAMTRSESFPQQTLVQMPSIDAANSNPNPIFFLRTTFVKGDMNPFFRAEEPGVKGTRCACVL